MRKSNKHRVAISLAILTVTTLVLISLNGSKNTTHEIYLFYYPEINRVSQNLQIDSSKIIKRSVLFKASFREQVSYAIASSVAQLDSYINRASLNKKELRRRLRDISRSAFLEVVKNPANTLQNDLVAIENFYRSRIYIDRIDQIQCRIKFHPGSLKESALLENLYGLPSGALKIADTVAEFVPVVGDVWGFTKFVYDPRVETMVLKPAENFFRPKIQSALKEYRLCLEQLYAEKSVIQNRLITDATLHTMPERDDS